MEQQPQPVQQQPIPHIPPHSDEAEKSVLSAMLQSEGAVALVQETLVADDFYDASNRIIYEACISLASKSRPVDLVTLDEELRRVNKLEAVGGILYLTALESYIPTSANVSSYIRIVDEKSTLRKLIHAADEIREKSYAQDDETSDILAAAEKSIYDITMRKGGEMLVPILDVLTPTIERMEELEKNKGKIEGVPSGFHDLDNVLTGFHPGEFILIAARPSIGKTSLGMNMVENAAIRHKKKVAVFSLEMPAEQLVMRMLCSEAGVDMQQVRRGALTMDDWTRLTDALPSIAEAQIFIDSTSGLSVQQVRSKARRIQMEKGLDLILIDYLSLMSAVGKFGSRQEEISTISRGLKGLAQELRIPIVVLQQLSRANTGRKDPRPVLSDIRDSGAIEQDADVVMFIHREAYYNPDTDKKNIAELRVAKQRNGPLQTIELGWQPEFTKFVDLPGSSPID